MIDKIGHLTNILSKLKFVYPTYDIKLSIWPAATPLEVKCLIRQPFLILVSKRSKPPIISFWRLLALKIVLNLSRTYEKLHCKGEPYRFSFWQYLNFIHENIIINTVTKFFLLPELFSLWVELRKHWLEFFHLLRRNKHGVLLHPLLGAITCLQKLFKTGHHHVRVADCLLVTDRSCNNPLLHQLFTWNFKNSYLFPPENTPLPLFTLVTYRKVLFTLFTSSTMMFSTFPFSKSQIRGASFYPGSLFVSTLTSTRTYSY